MIQFKSIRRQLWEAARDALCSWEKKGGIYVPSVLRNPLRMCPGYPCCCGDESPSLSSPSISTGIGSPSSPSPSSPPQAFYNPGCLGCDDDMWPENLLVTIPISDPDSETMASFGGDFILPYDSGCCYGVQYIDAGSSYTGMNSECDIAIRCTISAIDVTVAVVGGKYETTEHPCNACVQCLNCGVKRWIYRTMQSTIDCVNLDVTVPFDANTTCGGGALYCLGVWNISSGDCRVRAI